jgi:hypothetical protein
VGLLNDFDIIVSFDTEYVGGKNLDGVPQNENAVVSYQLSCLHPASSTRRSLLIPTVGPTKRHRRKFETVLHYAALGMWQRGVDLHADLRAEEEAARLAEANKPFRRKRRKPENPKPRRNLKIAAVAHFARADLPSFANFKRLKLSFDGVRGTYVTISRPAIFDIQTPNRARLKASVTLYDTRLLAPDGFRTLRALGRLLKKPKLTVPDVVGEDGMLVPGIKRMDLVAAQHPKTFAEYAIRDAEVALEYFERVAEFAESWGLKKIPPTIASIATARLRADAGRLLLSVLGREPTKRGGIGKFLPEALSIQNTASDGYLGGRNEAYAHGIFEALSDRPFIDFDLRGCYTSAMAEFRPVDWAAVEHTTDIERLATLDNPSVAEVDFRFPPDTRFPCLPVKIDGGLVYILEGQAVVTGPELVLARSMGAFLIVRRGVLVPWQERDIAEAELPFRDFAQLVNRERAKHGKGSLFEKLTKEAGNSIYGKLGQGVGEMKSVPENVTVFDTRDGSHGTMPPSSITCPILAAMTSGLARAVLSEILSRLPVHVRVLSATTDGWLSDCTVEEARKATEGPICRHFAKLRAMVDPNGSDEILEIKHKALKVLVARTRHGVTIEPCADSERFIARAGHRVPGDYDYDPEDKVAKADAQSREAAALVQLQRDRTFSTKLEVSSFISLSRQWEETSDLIEVHREVQVALCYDMKRQPIDPVDVDGLIQFQTRPFRTVDECKEWRRGLDRWKGASQAVLKTKADWNVFLVSRQAQRRRSYAIRSPFANAVLSAWSKGAGFSIRSDRGGRRAMNPSNSPSKSHVAKILNDFGVRGVTAKALENARAFEADPIGTVGVILPEDVNFARKLLAHTTAEGLASLLQEPLRDGFLTDLAALTGADGDLQTQICSCNPLGDFKVPDDDEETTEIVEQSSLAIDDGKEPPFFDRGGQDEIGSFRELGIAPEVASANPEKSAVESAVPNANATSLAITIAPSRPTLDELPQLARLTAAICRRFHITRARLMLAAKDAEKTPGRTERERRVDALAFAIRSKTKKPKTEVLALLHSIASEVLG